MNRRRLALVFFTIPVAVYAWACSSDSTGTPADTDAGTSPTSTTPPEPPPTPPPPPPGPDNDAGDGGPTVSCLGNPLTADGGTPDGGAVLDASVTTRILDETVALGSGNTFVDGPQFFDFAGGVLVFSELYSTPNPTLVRIQADGGARTVLRSTANTNQYFIGNADRDGGILSTLSVATPGNFGDAGLASTSLGGDAGASLALGTSTNPNDLVIGPKGDIYVTDPQFQAASAGTLAIYRVAPNGTVTSTQTAERVNGIALSPDASKLYVTGFDTNKVYAYPIANDGSVTNTPTAIVPTTAEAPDGMTVDVGGNLWVAEAASANGQSGRVEVFAADGKKLGEIPFPNQRPTSVAFGGADNKTLFVTVEKGIYVFSSRCAGLR